MSLDVVGFFVGLIGTLGTFAGLGLTYAEAKKARKAAQGASAAVEKFKGRMSQVEAGAYLSRADYALETAKRHLSEPTDWHSASLGLEDARRALSLVNPAALRLAEDRASIEKISGELTHLCKRIDNARVGKGRHPDLTKTFQLFRTHLDIIVTITRRIERDQ